MHEALGSIVSTEKKQKNKKTMTTITNSKDENYNV
jgi:hypothetical protein